jgi:hypothetical protein
VAEAELGRGRREEGFRGRGKNGRNGWEGMEEIGGTNFFFNGCLFFFKHCNFSPLDLLKRI